MMNKFVYTFLALTLAFFILTGVMSPAVRAETDGVVYGTVYVDNSPAGGVIVTCGDQSTTTLLSGSYFLNVDIGITAQVLASYDGHVALSDEFVTSEFPIRKDLNIILPDISTPTSAPVSTPAPTPSPGPSITRTYKPDSSVRATQPPTKTQSPGFAAMLTLLCLAGMALYMMKKRGR